MRLFLTILEGPGPSEAEAIFATEDQELIQLVGSWIEEKLSPGFHRDTRVPRKRHPEQNPRAHTLCFESVHDFDAGIPCERGGENE